MLLNKTFPSFLVCLFVYLFIIVFRYLLDFMWTLGGGSYYGGEVLVKFMNVAGKICPDDWTHTETRVACRELGFVNGSTYTHYLDTRSAPYWTTRVNCTGEEESLVDCHMAELGSVRKCHSRHSVGIICFEESGKGP